MDHNPSQPPIPGLSPPPAVTRGGFGVPGEPAAESATPITEVTRLPVPPAAAPKLYAGNRLGFDSDVPVGGAGPMNTGGDYPTGRADFMRSLYNGYVGCPWLSAPIDAVARTVTAGGLKIVPDADADPADTSATPPPQVQALQHLFDYCNPTQDIIQMLRGVLTDMQIYGDGFLEVVWLLGRPVALYALDPATVSIATDEHGEITGYDQSLDTRTAHFEPHEVIHIPMDSPRGGLYGMGVAQKAFLPVTIWMFTAATLKETMRKGDPPHLHIDFPLEVQPDDVRRWRSQYQMRNLGIPNIGNPVTTRGNATVTELQVGKIADYLATMNQARDTILSDAGVPPAQVGVIESGNLGGGTGSSQFKTFKVNTCGPLAAIVLEKLQFHLAVQGFGIDGWSIILEEVDWRDDKDVELIRDSRLRNGSWTLNRYLTDINEPAVGPEGDINVLVDRQNIVLWKQIGALSQAKIDALAPKPTPPPPAGGSPPPGQPAERAWRRGVTEHYRRQLIAALTDSEGR